MGNYDQANVTIAICAEACWIAVSHTCLMLDLGYSDTG